VRHPDARVLAHPECEEVLLRHAHHIGSTAALLRWAAEDPAQTFIVATEPGILHQMAKVAPGKTFLPVPGVEEGCACNVCPHMRRITLEKVARSLRDLEPRIELDEDLRRAALAPLERMMALGS
jgi:quinolinate synthase